MAFDKIHDGFFAAHGGHFMARAYRATFGRVLQNMTDAERDKLLVAFRALLALASSEPHTVQPCWVVAASDDARLYANKLAVRRPAEHVPVQAGFGFGPGLTPAQRASFVPSRPRNYSCWPLPRAV